MKTYISILVMVACFCGIANADLTLAWQTTPVLGIDSSYDGNVNIDNGGSPWANIPHDAVVPYGGPGQPTSITTFAVGQEVHTGSGVWVTSGHDYDWTAVFTDLDDSSRSKSYSGTFTGWEGFWMTWNSPDGGGDGLGLPTLTLADVGHWTYYESYTGTVGIEHTTEFTVVPVPAAVLLGMLGLSVAGIKLRKLA